MTNKIIIDTDPVNTRTTVPYASPADTHTQGIDDVLAMLLAASALPEELQILLISVTYGNIDVQNCLRNVVSLFHQVDKEVTWRKSQGHPPGFDALRSHKPLVAVGPEHPLADQMLMADYFRERRPY